MQALYQNDLAYVHAASFGTLARGAAGEIVRRLRTCTVPIRKVMDMGCGAGPLTEALLNAGFEVTGVDTSAELLHYARATAPAAHFIHASAYEVEILGYDAVIAVGEPLAYHAESADADTLIDRFFRNAAAALPPGGVLIFDVIGLGEPSLAGRTWRSGEDWAVLVETRENQVERTLVRDIETFRRMGEVYRRSRELHRVRLFDVEELYQQLTACGFATEITQSYGAQQLPPRRYAFFATRVVANGSDPTLSPRRADERLYP